MKNPTLESVLQYKHPQVLNLYKQNHPTHFLDAETAFEEMLKYLWLMNKHKQDKALNQDDSTIPTDFIMLRSMREIDDMWHEFILFTKDYTDFCLEYFGEYLHHLPNLFDTAPRPREEVENDVAKLLPYVYDNLGEVSLRRWFVNYL